MGELITTYEPDNSLKKGYLNIFKEISCDFKNNRWLTYQLFKRDFFSNYKQSFIGILWAFIVPLVSVGAFVILNKAGILNIGNIPVPYPIYALIGMAFWQLFSAGLIASSQSLITAGDMLVKINFSKKSLVIASLGRSFVAFLFQMVLVVFLCVYYQVIPSLMIVMMPVALLPLLLLTLGLGFFFALFNCVVRDIGSILSMGMTYLMFLTPVLYAKPLSGFLAKLTHINPLYYLIITPRELALTGEVTELFGFLISTILSVFIFILCLIIFHLTETRVVERL